MPGWIAGLTFIVLRHSFCSNLAAQGVSLHQIQALAGRKSPMATSGSTEIVR